MGEIGEGYTETAYLSLQLFYKSKIIPKFNYLLKS